MSFKTIEIKLKGILLLFGFLSMAGKSFSQKFNTDAITKFWQVVDYLKKDKPLNDSVWYAYYNLEGNKNFIDYNRPPENAIEHRQYLELLFRPSFADSLLSFEKSHTSFDTDIFPNLKYIKQNEKQLRIYTQQVISPDYLPICIALAKKYLPKNKFKPLSTNETIYVNAMTFDAATQNNSIYLGLSIVYEFDKYQKGTVTAHELHHNLRINKMMDNKVSTADSASFSIINQINNEGSADLIDKIVIQNNQSTIYRGNEVMNWLMENAETTLRKLDSCFLVNEKNDTNYLSSWGFRIITNYSSGHIPGFYMTDVICRNGYEQELIDHNDDPFYFFYLYERVAKTDIKKPVLFSKAAMNYIHQLEKRCFKN